MPVDQAEGAAQILVEHEVLAHQADRLDRVFLKLASPADRLPVAAQEIAHRRAGADAGGRSLRAAVSISSNPGWSAIVLASEPGARPRSISAEPNQLPRVLWPEVAGMQQYWADVSPAGDASAGCRHSGQDVRFDLIVDRAR
jgi:hypothetical protein